MKQKGKTILLLAAFALFIVLAVVGYNLLKDRSSQQSDIFPPMVESTEAPTPQASVGAQPQESDQKANPPAIKPQAPDFTVENINGNQVKLSDFIGTPVVLNFWASWCPPCKGEMPEFQEVSQEVGEDVAFLMVDLVDGQRETKDKGIEYIKEQGFTFPVYFDVDQDAASRYGIMSIPTTIFIHKDGYILTGVQGAIDSETLRKGIGLIK
ncbi:MAG: redoxin domain-containing protein [Clostridiales bacterium]|nr:redoxin domain-containing protein [Clostridiales bacterium]